MAEQKATNVTWHDHKVSKAERSKLNGHKGAVLWFTGLSACGKSTIANTVDHLENALLVICVCFAYNYSPSHGSRP